MSNKLQLLKKKLLSNRPAAASSEQRFDHFSNAPSNQMSSPQLQSKENVNSKSCENQQQIGQSKAEENIRGQTQSPEISSQTYQKQSKSAENIQISAKAVIEEKKEPWPKAVPQAQDIQEGEIKKTQQIVLKHKDEPALNLDYVERYPNLSCSVDDEVKAPVTLSAFDGIQKPEALQKESKQQQKKQKIVLKELEFVKESIRNLRSAVKGLQLLQKMAAQNPAIKGKIKGFLKEINIENLC